MSRIIGFSVRSSGRDLTVVRRPQRIRAVAKAVVAEPPDYSESLKADLVSLAESRGVDSTGTKADIVERLKAADG